MRRNEEIIFVRRKSAVMLFSEFMINFMFVWPFKFIRWCIRKIRDKRYDIDFSDYSDVGAEAEIIVCIASVGMIAVNVKTVGNVNFVFGHFFSLRQNFYITE